MLIIIKNKPNRLGKTRSEVERNLNSEGWNSMSEEQRDKVAFAERKLGATKSFVRLKDIREQK